MNSLDFFLDICVLMHQSDLYCYYCYYSYWKRLPITSTTTIIMYLTFFIQSLITMALNHSDRYAVFAFNCTLLLYTNMSRLDSMAWAIFFVRNKSKNTSFAPDAKKTTR